MDKNKKLLYEREAELVKAIAHPLRVGICHYLEAGEKCVCDIAEYLGAERSNVSRHLAVMVNAGVLGYEKRGLKVIYSLKTKCVLKFLGCVGECLREQIKESERVLRAL